MISRSRGAMKPQWMFLLLVVVFAAPVLGSWYLFFFTDFGRDAAAHGQLVEPPVPLPDVSLFDPVTGSTGERLHGKWTLVSLAGTDCGGPCEEHLYRMRQLRLAMGKDAVSMQRLLVVDGDSLEVLSPSLLAEYRGQLLVNAAAFRGHFGGSPFSITPADHPVDAGRLYLVDPAGFLMMRYEKDASPDGIIRDLKRLLKYSRHG